MWYRIANAYGHVMMPLLVWTIFLIGFFLVLVIGYQRNRLQFLAKTPLRFLATSITLWLVHFFVMWYVIRSLIGFGWHSHLHLSRAEDVEFWRTMALACSEMAIVSTLLSILASTLLFSAIVIRNK